MDRRGRTKPVPADCGFPARSMTCVEAGHAPEQNHHDFLIDTLFAAARVGRRFFSSRERARLRLGRGSILCQ
ncbi:hypothetical protein C7S16_5311 [Burkholderia thailandensis]|uniref:Uncharacterized protein n=1 Tax=Burkholderia thailandensis TaxID=57975 RepID=A0AAW9CJL4_BURTH|nr:hypothetical protein [Burkholderia thailandensis]MDW9251003.1 hypothetical protein [Burkholderia thailandensis]